MKKKFDTYNDPINKEQLQPIYSYFDQVFDFPKPFTTDLIIMNEKLTNPRQKIIQMDSLRTRSEVFNQQLKNQLQIILTHYCRIHEIQYKQGLNQIAAPFIYFRKIGASLGKCEILFHHFFTKYCMNFYFDKDFNSIQMFSKMFSIVLKYHIPTVFRFLEWHKVEPQIFCISWLMTIFASKISLKMTYELWEFYIAENDKFLLFFLAVAIMLYNKENIIQTKNVNILEIVTNLIWGDSDEMQSVIATSLLLRKNTPCSLVIFFRDRMIFEKRTNYQAISSLLEHIQNLNLFLVLPSQMILANHYKNGLCDMDCYFCDLKKPIKILGTERERLKNLIDLSNDIRYMEYQKQFVIVDVRRNQTKSIQYEGSVFQIDIQEDIEVIEQKFISKFMEQKSKKHFIFILTTFSFQDIENCDERQLDICKDMLTILISMSFPFLSILQGGFAGFFNQTLQLKDSMIQSEVFQKLIHEKGLKLPLSFELKLSDIFVLGRSLVNRDYVSKIGQTEILLLTKFYVFVFTLTEQTSRLFNYFIHNNSIIDFLYSKTKGKVQIHIKKRIPIWELKKISMKFYHQNTIVLKYEYCQEHLIPLFKNFNEYFNHSPKMIKILKNKCKICQKESKKILFDFQNIDQVNQCSEILTKKYKEIKNALKNVNQI